MRSGYPPATCASSATGRSSGCAIASPAARRVVQRGRISPAARDAEGSPMTPSHCRAPVGDDALVAYWLGELDESAEASLELHLLACGECSERLAGIVALADGLRRAVDEGAVRMFVTSAFVK